VGKASVAVECFACVATPIGKLAPFCVAALVLLI